MGMGINQMGMGIKQMGVGLNQMGMPAFGRLVYLPLTHLPQRIAAPHPDHRTPWPLALHCHIDAPAITH
jgi:hypothetical protein